ncbi:NUDIX domain-containing protein [Streptomyces sp. IpFD-1.1]|uniref:NUDIX hydrolase n=1 Tax=Streptomyces TaxID=1883 RepID=UPI002094EB88|nr:NUDIX domain-containing protein [Streptomyces sp. IpFD-1.1]MCO6751961.1 NUDIX domain-containing protein [Streptomyces sp. IpFD-1.1]
MPDTTPSPTPTPVPTSRPPVPGSHCSACGTPYPDPGADRRLCPACGTTAYRNPLPVAVALLPVRDGEGPALLTVVRAIAPARGTTALPGGFIDGDEDWRHAVVRELCEETGVLAGPDEVTLADAMSSGDGHLLLFGLLPERPAASLPAFTPTAETSATRLLRAPAELGFPLHTRAAAAWFAGRYG